MKQKELYDLLFTTTEYTGTFAHSAVHATCPNPGLHIDGFGTLRLPVSADDAERLLEIGKISPFGKGKETVVDKEVRSSQQIEVEAIKIENTNFQEWLQESLVGETARVLGIEKERSPRLNLYKLLIYKEGGHFKAHKE